jgi:hypothetical protein
MVVKPQSWPFPVHRDDAPKSGLGDIECLKIDVAETTVRQTPIFYGNLRKRLAVRRVDRHDATIMRTDQQITGGIDTHPVRGGRLRHSR